MPSILEDTLFNDIDWSKDIKFCESNVKFFIFNTTEEKALQYNNIYGGNIHSKRPIVIGQPAKVLNDIIEETMKDIDSHK